MSNEINLVSGNNASLDKQKQRLIMSRYGAIGSLVFVALISVVIFLLNVGIGLSSIKNDENSTLQNITSLRQKSVKLEMVNNRITDISQILNKRKNYSESIKFLQGQIPQDVRVSSLEVNKTNLAVIVNSTNLLSINKFLENIISLSLNKKFLKNILIESLMLNSKSGLYSLSIKAVLL